jgi:NAD(P)-dependent dehydrogenase (short-subunit alcohol dehydrogenase family)
MQTKFVAVVTGASQGIGRATAIRLARDFEAIVLTARQEDELGVQGGTLADGRFHSNGWRRDQRNMICNLQTKESNDV